MLASGLLEEVYRPLRQAALPAAPSRSFHRLPRTARVLNGELKLEEAQAAIHQRDAPLLPTQLTWFRRDTPGSLVAGFGQDARFQQQALCLGARPTCSRLFPQPRYTIQVE